MMIPPQLWQISFLSFLQSRQGDIRTHTLTNITHVGVSIIRRKQLNAASGGCLKTQWPKCSDTWKQTPNLSRRLSKQQIKVNHIRHYRTKPPTTFDLPKSRLTHKPSTKRRMKFYHLTLHTKHNCKLNLNKIM